MSAVIAASSSATGSPAAAPAANLDVELAKCESQLSDWVHCPSSKTSAGKAKIAEITAKRDGIKARVTQRDEATTTEAAAKREPKPTPVTPAAVHGAVSAAAPRLRLSGLGTYLDIQA